MTDLEKIIDAKKTQLQDLAKRREALAKEIESVDAEIQQLVGEGGTFRYRRRRRVKNEKSLRSVVLDILGKAKRGYTLADLADKVKETGYKSGSRNFRNVLYQCLYNTEGIKHNEATGCYQLV